MVIAEAISRKLKCYEAQIHEPDSGTRPRVEAIISKSVLATFLATLAGKKS